MLLFSDDLHASDQLFELQELILTFRDSSNTSLEALRLHCCGKCLFAAPPGGPPQYNTIFGSRLSSSSTPARSDFV